MTIPLSCSSYCNPLCKIAWYKDGQQEDEYNPVINIRRDRRMSGVFQCEASGVEGKVKSPQVQVIIQCKLFVILYYLDFFGMELSNLNLATIVKVRHLPPPPPNWRRQHSIGLCYSDPVRY